ncbi:MAG: YqaE/Pmp3 family membrane protein [Fimbriimonadaceae bacterium]|nr:YqaE/Pmp3 family membrane protein [Fimbriimonadaceae bacterium]
MPWYRVVLSVVCPPLAVIDRGVKPLLLTLVLTVLGWVPGTVCALVYSSEPAEQASF